jgi:hypothetical protein
MEASGAYVIENMARLGRLERPTSGSGGEESAVVLPIFSRLALPKFGLSGDIRAPSAASMQLSVQPSSRVLRLRVPLKLVRAAASIPFRG